MEWDHNMRCKESVAKRADELAAAIRNGTLNASVFERLMLSFIDQPAFSLMDKRELMKIAMYRV